MLSFKDKRKDSKSRDDSTETGSRIDSTLIRSNGQSDFLSDGEVFDGFAVEGRKLFSDDTFDDCDGDSLEIDYDVLISYYNQIYVRKIAKKELHTDTIDSFEKRRRRNGEIVIDMCKNSQLSPYIVAKRWIERLERDGVINYNTVTNFIDQIDSFPDQKLGKELLECICEDHVLSHTSNQIKDVIGKVYEDFLIQKLVDRKMVFETENDLRNKGHSKTPDIHFLIPMGIMRTSANSNGSSLNVFNSHKSPFSASQGGGSRSHSNSDTDNNILLRSSSGESTFDFSAFDRDRKQHSPIAGVTSPMSLSSYIYNSLSRQNTSFIVNWIDSKALFADEETFEENCPQFEEYLSRYGRGLVIYWHGFTEGVPELATRKWGPDMVIIVDSFPEEWIFPTRDVLDKSPDYLKS